MLKRVFPNLLKKTAPEHPLAHYGGCPSCQGRPLALVKKLIWKRVFSASRAWNGKPEAAAARPWVHSLCLMPCASPEQSHAPAAGSAMAQHHGNLILELPPLPLLHGIVSPTPRLLAPATSRPHRRLHIQRRNGKRTHPLRTTMKSMTFQPLRRYEPLWKMNPRATILIPASKQKIPMK